MIRSATRAGGTGLGTATVLGAAQRNGRCGWTKDERGGGTREEQGRTIEMTRMDRSVRMQLDHGSFFPSSFPCPLHCHALSYYFHLQGSVSKDGTPITTRLPGRAYPVFSIIRSLPLAIGKAIKVRLSQKLDDCLEPIIILVFLACYHVLFAYLIMYAKLASRFWRHV